jgi:hypothetical protein
VAKLRNDTSLSWAADGASEIEQGWLREEWLWVNSRDLTPTKEWLFIIFIIIVIIKIIIFICLLFVYIHIAYVCAISKLKAFPDDAYRLAKSPIRLMLRSVFIAFKSLSAELF